MLCGVSLFISESGGYMRTLSRVWFALRVGITSGCQIIGHVWEMDLDDGDKLRVNIEFEINPTIWEKL